MSIFLDTSYLIAYANDRDPNHVRAVALSEHMKNLELGYAFTTTYVVDEAITYTLQKENHEKAVEMGERLMNSEIEVLEISMLDFEEAWALFKKTGNMSFTDCTTVALMLKKKMRNIATFDSGFRQFREMSVLG